jgi:hypothetical protein
MSKLTKAEAGRLGAIASLAGINKRTKERAERYNLAPTRCKNCDKVFSYQRRTLSFCDKTCAATFNNRHRKFNRKPVEWQCLNCDKKHVVMVKEVTDKNSLDRKYCDNKCQHEHYFTAYLDQWRMGVVDGLTPGGRVVSYVVQYLRDKLNNSCSSCGIEAVWNNKPLILEVEHINGNSSDNSENNLSLLCPNCHSQTDTFKARNKGNGRKHRYKK